MYYKYSKNTQKTIEYYNLNVRDVEAEQLIRVLGGSSEFLQLAQYSLKFRQ